MLGRLTLCNTLSLKSKWSTDLQNITAKCCEKLKLLCNATGLDLHRRHQVRRKKGNTDSQQICIKISEVKPQTVNTWLALHMKVQTETHVQRSREQPVLEKLIEESARLFHSDKVKACQRRLLEWACRHVLAYRLVMTQTGIVCA